ncbi:MAG TPA: NAD-dependent epimerase/dehydratase family protein [Bacteroidales bacterium]|nr:NAD-dependent epimerase/dehydratase family protein [Bacteroidales bacterium]
MKIRAIITGSTGMVGEGVLEECLSHPDVEKVLVINRSSCGVNHPKLTEILHTNFLDITAIADQMTGYNACFFCLGVSSVGMKKADYHRLTYTLTMHIAEILANQNPGMTFCYVSGAGTDSTEKGRLYWARVKGKTENDLMKLAFKKAYAFRPGFMLPARDAKNAHGYYAFFRVLYPVLKFLLPNLVTTLQVVAAAMIKAVLISYEKPVLEVKDIIVLSEK